MTYAHWSLDSLPLSESPFVAQIYKVSNMELVRVLPSAEDEVNVASFHPLVGGGLVYGTKVNNETIFIYFYFF